MCMLYLCCKCVQSIYVAQLGFYLYIFSESSFYIISRHILLQQALIGETGRKSKFMERKRKFLHTVRLGVEDVSYYSAVLSPEKYFLPGSILLSFDWLTLNFYEGYSRVATTEMQKIMLGVHKIMTSNNSPQSPVKAYNRYVQSYPHFCSTRNILLRDGSTHF